jgi:hypothetical protein
MLKNFFLLIMDVFTLGGATAYRDAKEEYAKEYAAYKTAFDNIQSVNERIRLELVRIAEFTESSMKLLRYAEKWLQRGTDLMPADNTRSLQLSIKRIGRVWESYTDVASATVSGVGSSALAVGAWSVVSVLGSASTGTAIASLSGAAASNATLAWFGGGALAAGGAGVAGGTMVIGGILVVPVIAYSTYRSYKKADELAEHTQKVIEATRELRLMLPEVCENLGIAIEALPRVRALYRQLDDDIDQFKSEMFAVPLCSRFMLWLKRFFGRNTLTERQQKAIEKLEQSVDRFILEFSHNQLSRTENDQSSLPPPELNS